MKKQILIFISLLIVSCNSYDKDENKNYQNLYDNNTLKDYELFNLANQHIESGLLDLALIELDKIEVLYPSSSFAKKSILLTAYINFLKKDYEKTRALSEMYKNYYPGSKDIVYANYLEAMSYYVVMKKTDYSQENSEKALEKFKFILNAYPNSRYEIDIITKIRIINDNLATNKLKIAKYYIERNNINGSLLYLNDIFKNHSSSSAIKETLFLMSKIYYSIDEYELAKNYSSILAYNFPNSQWYEKSYKIINGLEEIKNDEKWFQKFNPIKIIQDEMKINSNEISIQTIE